MIDSWPVVEVDSFAHPLSEVVAVAAMMAAAPILKSLDLGAIFVTIFNFFLQFRTGW